MSASAQGIMFPSPPIGAGDDKYPRLRSAEPFVPGMNADCNLSHLRQMPDVTVCFFCPVGQGAI